MKHKAALGVSEATWAYIRRHADGDVRQLALAGTQGGEVDLPFALNQIAGRKMAQRKLPTWAACDGIIYPAHLSMEQCSSEAAARYKATLAGRGERFVDLTGGLGVDFWAIAGGFREAVYVERQAELCSIAAHNIEQLGLRSARVVCSDSAAYLSQMDEADVVMIDPARRDEAGRRTYDIADCSPDVRALLPLLLEKAGRVLLKLSPMLDWHKAVSDVGAEHVEAVHVVAVRGECKELLLVLQREKPAGPLRLVSVDGDSRFECTAREAAEAPVFRAESLEALQGHMLYEPNASIMKSGCFAALARQFGVGAVGPGSHLFVSSEMVENFPGRAFRVIRAIKLSKSDERRYLKGVHQANIAVRNFPMSVAGLRRRLGITEGGNLYIFATTLSEKRRTLILTMK